MTVKRAQRVQNLVRQSFHSASYPGDDQLVVPYNGPDDEWRDVHEYLAGNHWSALSLKVLWRVRDCLNFLTPAARRFYLPAFLIAALDQDADILMDNVMNCLCTSMPQEEIAGYTEEERWAVLAVIDLLELQSWPDGSAEEGLRRWAATPRLYF